MGIVNISVVSTLKMRLSKKFWVWFFTHEQKIDIHTNVEGLLPPHFGNVQIISQKNNTLACIWGRNSSVSQRLEKRSIWR